MVRRRLSSARKKKEEADAATEEASSALAKAKETKQTLDQQVAERKFLRKSDEGKESSRRSSQRAKLRSSMSDDSKLNDRAEAARQDESGVQETSASQILRQPPHDGPQALLRVTRRIKTRNKLLLQNSHRKRRAHRLNSSNR